MLAVNLLWAFQYRHLLAHGQAVTLRGLLEALTAAYHQLQTPLGAGVPGWDTS